MINQRQIATNEIVAGDFIRVNDRTYAPEVATMGDIRVASFNVLNYFTDAFEGYDANPTNGNRDAVTVDDALLQRTKIVNAIKEMNADIVGLMEIENNGYGLINLNTQAHGADTYSYSYSGELGNLDHALGNASVAERLVAIEDWHINSVESTLFEYPSKYTGDLEKSENVFSASDHGPVIIALSYPAPVAPVDPVNPVEPENDDDGGSLGFLGLAMLSLFGLRRRIR